MESVSAPLAGLANVSAPPAPTVEVDESDLALLRALAETPAGPSAHWPATIEMSAPAVAERLARLERAGVIRGYRVDIDWAALGYPVVVYLAVNRRPRRGTERDHQKAISALPEAQDMSVVTGGMDLLVRLRVRDHAHLRERPHPDLQDQRRPAHRDVPVPSRRRTSQLHRRPANPDDHPPHPVVAGGRSCW